MRKSLNLKAAPRFPSILLAVALLLLVVAGADAQSFQIFLRNGDRLTGTVLAEDASQVTLTNAILGRFILPLSVIERREAILADTTQPSIPSTNAPVADRQKQWDALQNRYFANQISAEEYHRQRAALLAVHPAPLTTKAPETSIVAKPAPKPAPSLTGELFAGTDLNFGSKSRQIYTGRVKMNYSFGHFRNMLDLLTTYGKTDGEITANRMDGTLKTDYDLTPRSYLYSLAGTGYDEIRQIDGYYQLGPGYGYHVVKQTNFVLSAESGFNYQVQNFADGREDDFFYYRFAGLLKWTINTRFSFDEKLEYFPQWDDAGEYKVRFEANLRYWLKSNLSLNLTVINLYDTRVATGIEPNDLQIRSSIGVKF